MKILSLFDWMSCGQQAITNLWITDYTYYSSEIDKYAIQVTQNNFPNTIQIWDVTKIKWEDYKDITLLAWWSPCQWFSFAWKQLNFEDERSKLFFEYVRILKEVKPKYFLLENVKMKKEYQDVISEHLFWIQPTILNSSLLTAQNRVRLYWVWELQEDWTYKQVKIEQPQDRWILLKDILEDEVDEKYNISEKQWEKLLNYESNSRLSPLDWKSYCLNTMQWWHRQSKIITHNIIEKVKVRKYDVNIDWLKKCLKNHKNQTIKEIAEKLNQPKTLVEHWFRNDNSFAIPWEDIWLELKELLSIKTNEFDKSIMEFEIRDWKFDSSNRAYDIQWKCATLTSSLEPKIAYAPWSMEFKAQGWKLNKSPTLCARDYKDPKIVMQDYKIRKLTPIECERLQWVKDNYTSSVSNSQRYKMLWNGWTIPVIEHIFKHLTPNQ